ncbi:DinB family protein [Bacillus sp. FJAT-29790]|nr:DinB family protein [Bacillus sp. FJAT-29790]
MLNHFLSHRSVTNNLVQKIDEANYEYKPTETSMTAQKLVTHMYTSFHKFVKTIKDGNASPFIEKLETTHSNLNHIGEDFTEKSKDLIASLTDQELDQVIDLTKVFGMELTGRQLFQMAMDHEIHHKGNLFVYVRGMGHTDLPMFIGRG